MATPVSAGLLRRIAAMGYDSLLVFSLLFGATALYGWLARLINPGPSSVTITNDSVVKQIEPVASGPLFNLYLVVIIIAFFVYFWRKSGQTLGMQAWRLRIDSLDGGRINTGQALLRLAVAPLSAACLGLGYLWVLIDREQRSWHDICSRSRVVLLPKKK